MCQCGDQSACGEMGFPSKTSARPPHSLQLRTLQLQDRRLIAKDELSFIAQLVDLFRVENERPVLGWLPSTRVQQLPQDKLRVR